MDGRTEMVKFPDGSEEPKMMVISYFDRLMTLATAYPQALHELLKLCNNESYELGIEKETLTDLGLIFSDTTIHPFLPGTKIHPNVKKIILFLTTEKDGRIEIKDSF